MVDIVASISGSFLIVVVVLLCCRRTTLKEDVIWFQRKFIWILDGGYRCRKSALGNFAQRPENRVRRRGVHWLDPPKLANWRVLLNLQGILKR